MKRNFGVKSKLLVSFISFSVLVIALLWLLEVVFLDQIYRAIKINSVRKIADGMRGLGDEQLISMSTHAASSVGLCFSIYDENLNLLAEEHSGGQCVVHNLSQKTVAVFYEATSNFENKRFESHLSAQEIMNILKRHEHSLKYFQFPQGFFLESEPILSASSDAYDCILYSQIFENGQGVRRYALISSVLLPIDSTVQTIRFELNLLIGILIVVSILMSIILSKTISSPIAKLNKAAKTLPDGHFDGQNIKGYREVEELAETLRKSALEIQQVDRLRRELIANVSHDLRTPLTLISAYSEIMRDIPGENTPENLQVVIDESHRLSELVTDLLDLSKLEAGIEQLNRERVELISFVREILNRYKKMTGFSGYSLNFETEFQELFVLADPIKLNQIVYNLVNNAINYCGDDKTVIVRIEARDGEAILQVIDHGEGIPQDKLDHIWDRYYRAEKSHQTATIGTGLGLSIVKKHLSLHNSNFGVESSVGKGSMFWFTLQIVE